MGSGYLSNRKNKEYELEMVTQVVYSWTRLCVKRFLPTKADIGVMRVRFRANT